MGEARPLRAGRKPGRRAQAPTLQGLRLRRRNILQIPRFNSPALPGIQNLPYSRGMQPVTRADIPGIPPQYKIKLNQFSLQIRHPMICKSRNLGREAHPARPYGRPQISQIRLFEVGHTRIGLIRLLRQTVVRLNHSTLSRQPRHDAAHHPGQCTGVGAQPRQSLPIAGGRAKKEEFPMNPSGCDPFVGRPLSAAPRAFESHLPPPVSTEDPNHGPPVCEGRGPVALMPGLVMARPFQFSQQFLPRSPDRLHNRHRDRSQPESPPPALPA